MNEPADLTERRKQADLAAAKRGAVALVLLVAVPCAIIIMVAGTWAACRALL